MPRFAEFFAGIGLVREALEPLDWECVFANDIAEGKAEMYRERFGSDDLVVADVSDLTIEDIPDEVELMTASFPCIDLSLAGNRAGLAGEHSGAIWPFLDLVEQQCARDAAPKALLLENVTGFLTSHDGRDLSEVCERVAALGYSLDLAVVDARWFTPQSRPRLFVMAVRSHEHLPWLPATDQVSRTRTRGIRRFQAAHRRLSFIELDIPEPPARARETLASVLQDVEPDDERWWPAEQTKAMLASMESTHRERVDGLLKAKRGGVATLFRRRRRGKTVGEVRGDKIAGCLRTPQGGSSVQFLVDCRSGEPRIRPLTGREYARLQGATGFPINVGDRQAQMGFGDAVCVPAVTWLARHAFAHLTHEAVEADGLQTRFAEPEDAVYAAGS